MKHTLLTFVFLSLVMSVSAQEQLKYSDFDSWLSRDIKESKVIGGETKTLYEIAPAQKWNGKHPYVNQGGSPWATSNVMAKVAGIVKTNASVYRDTRGHGFCAKLVTHVVGVKVLGLVNIHVMAAGSVYLGQMVEPITSSSNPMSKLNYGIPFTQKPKAVKFDYKVQLSGKPDRIRQTGFSAVKTIAGADMPMAVCLLQKRWEDEKGNIYARRIGTLVQRFSKNTDWVNGAVFDIHYGDITHESFYKSYMHLFNGGDDQKYAMNSKGKMVPVQEVEWGTVDDTPTHLCLQFASSYGGAYIGAEGTTLWVDNVKLVY